eukprot:g5333.t1
MVDYSKWDNLQVSDSEEDIDDDGGSGPNFTRLAEPSAVTIGPGGISRVAAQGDAAPRQSVSELATAAPLAAAAPAAPHRHGQDDASRLTRNGSTRDGCAWCQDREFVVLHVLLPARTRAKQVAVTLRDNMLVVRCGGEAVLEGRLAGQVCAESDDGGAGVDADEGVEWELVDDGARWLARVLGRGGGGGGGGGEGGSEGDAGAAPRLCRITLKKRSAIPGTVQWWSRAFEGDSEIDVAAIPDRRGHNVMSSWQAADRQFKAALHGRG